MSCSTCKKGCHKNTTICPLCEKATHKVLTDEVYGMIKDEVRKCVYATQFHFCDNEDCEAVFHSTDSEEIILTQDIIKKTLDQVKEESLSEK